MTALPTPRGTNDLDEGARVRDLAFELLDTLAQVAKYEHVMETQFSNVLRSRIRRILKEAHGE